MNKIGLLKELYFKNDSTYLYEIKNILKDYSEITQVLNYFDDRETIKFCFRNNKKINEILYEKEEFILINKIDFRLSFIFFLDFLIKDKLYLIDYTYEPKLINELYHLNFKNNKERIKKLIVSKVIIDLINNAKGFDSIDNNTEKSFTEINDLNFEIIKSNINILKEYKLNFSLEEFINKKIDKIYIELIINLIKDKIVENYEKASRIMIQLDLENIEITKTMLDELNELLKSKEKKANYTLIKKLDENKINFYYILIKYILKNSIFIYNSPFLLNARRFFRKIIKEKKRLDWLLCYYFNNHEIVERLEFLIKTIMDSDYYYNKYLELIENGIINKKSNEFLENRNLFGSLEKYYCFYYIINILQKFSMTINIYLSKEEKIINYIFSINYYNNKLNYKQLIDIKNNILKIPERNNIIDDFIKFSDFLDLIKKCLLKTYNRKPNIIIKLDFNRNSNELECIYSFFSENNKKFLSYKDENILNNNFKINEGFLYLLNDLNDEFSDSEMYSNQKILDITNLDDNNCNQNEFQFMKYIYKIGNYEKAKNIKQLSNGYYLIIGESFFSLYDLLNNLIVKNNNFMEKIDNIW